MILFGEVLVDKVVQLCQNRCEYWQSVADYDNSIWMVTRDSPNFSLKVS